MHKVDAMKFGMDPVGAEGAEGVRIQWLVDESHCAPNFAMRRFIVEPGGCTPSHSHDWEHEVYILRGRGVLVTAEGDVEVGPNMALFLAPNEVHQFRAMPDGSLEFLCIVPNGPATVH